MKAEQLPREEFAIAKWRGSFLFKTPQGWFCKWSDRDSTLVAPWPQCANSLPKTVASRFHAACDSFRALENY